MDGPYLNCLIPIVGGVAASAWAPMSRVTTPMATPPRLHHRSARVSFFMVFSSTSSHVRTLRHKRRSMRVQEKVWRGRIAASGTNGAEERCGGCGKIRMSEKLSLKESSGANPAWLAVPLMVFALITVTVGLVARQTVRESYATPFFHPFFTDTLQMKAWLVTAAVVLACGQLLTAARIYELLRFPPKGRLYHPVPRWSGRVAILLTFPVAYHCVFLLGFETHSPRILIHSLLGSALYGAVVAKVLIVRSTRFAPWVLPVAGGLLFSILLGLWLTSALWFFTAATT